MLFLNTWAKIRIDDALDILKQPNGEYRVGLKLLLIVFLLIERKFNIMKDFDKSIQEVQSVLAQLDQMITVSEGLIGTFNMVTSGVTADEVPKELMTQYIGIIDDLRKMRIMEGDLKALLNVCTRIMDHSKMFPGLYLGINKTEENKNV